MNVHGIIKETSFWGLQVKDPNATRFSTAITSIAPKPMIMKTINQNRTLPKVASRFDLGRMVNDGLVFRQNIYVRSYEVGPEQTTSIETIMNYLQETSLNHLKSIGILHDGFGSTLEMCRKNLIWVMAKMQVVVDRCPTWGDVVEIDTWKAASGKTGMCCNWLFRDCKTGEILIRASSIWVMMNKETRRLSKFPYEVRAELEQHFLDTPPLVNQDAIKWSKHDQNIVDHVCNGLTPSWSDLDINRHVNNVKYTGWVLQSVPEVVMENYELVSMALEYCRECTKNSVLESHTFVNGSNSLEVADCNHVDCQHLLQLEGIGGNGEMIMKASSRWRPKHAS
ncbi:hypothetical protein QVD17_26095 [Tagetes erecta]|uniref:Acyl-[acyl-carrier-protein] hydrolase n=1 Tax=Tagetes erecta TaxID=13708 RepID=A0AAD8K5U9_TARER|nr:hypothetical protein QVD17_26095 [Tagetes erecta]